MYVDIQTLRAVTFENRFEIGAPFCRAFDSSMNLESDRAELSCLYFNFFFFGRIYRKENAVGHIVKKHKQKLGACIWGIVRGLLR